jgi:hypothetical protein
MLLLSTKEIIADMIAKQKNANKAYVKLLHIILKDSENISNTLIFGYLLSQFFSGSKIAFA